MSLESVFQNTDSARDPKRRETFFERLSDERAATREIEVSKVAEAIVNSVSDQIVGAIAGDRIQETDATAVVDLVVGILNERTVHVPRHTHPQAANETASPFALGALRPEDRPSAVSDDDDDQIRRE